MWVSKYNRWHPNVTPLEKFLAGRIIQRCDYSEIISNKHRTANGYTQIKELIKLCELTLKRSKTVKTLIVILQEATSKYVKQNIANDLIIEKYFVDLKGYIIRIDSNKLVTKEKLPNLTEINKLLHQLKIFEIQLDDHYFEVLKKEFLQIDYSGNKDFERKANQLSNLIDLLIPYLVFKGYSISSLSEVLISWLKRGYRPTIVRIFNFFHFNSRPFSFLQFLGQKNSEVEDFIELLREDLNTEVKEINAIEFGTEFVKENCLNDTDILASYQYEALDPHNHVRYCYDRLLKRVVIKKERQSLATFNNFFDKSFWSNTINHNGKKIKAIALEGDPINVNSRGRTLRNTLIKCSQEYNYSFTEENDIPIPDIEQLRNSIYYYNLALGSKSIENSLSLLWTSLEAILPYRTAGSDIECIQHFISSSLGIGAICRDIHAFALRFIQDNQQNENIIGDLGTRGFVSHYSKDGIIQWFKWMTDTKNVKEKFDKVKNCSELLAYQYSNIGRSYSEKNLEYILNRIKSSEESMKYQLQRIYLHRNQIVHSGDLVNEYTNLWMHLEWYVGKLLAYFIIKIHFTKEFINLEDALRKLEADHDYLCSYLEKNPKVKITEASSRLSTILFQHSWQSF